MQRAVLKDVKKKNDDEEPSGTVSILLGVWCFDVLVPLGYWLSTFMLSRFGLSLFMNQSTKFYIRNNVIFQYIV